MVHQFGCFRKYNFTTTLVPDAEAHSAFLKGASLGEVVTTPTGTFPDFLVAEGDLESLDLQARDS